MGVAAHYVLKATLVFYGYVYVKSNVAFLLLRYVLKKIKLLVYVYVYVLGTTLLLCGYVYVLESTLYFYGSF